MGKRGPKPESMEVREAKGSHRARGAKAENKCRVMDSEPVKPEGMAPDASAIWDYTLPILQAMYVVDVSNSIPLANYCELQAKLNSYTDYESSKRGFLPETIEQERANNTLKSLEDKSPNTYLNGWKETHKLIAKYQDEFGLTPSSRGTIDKVFSGPKKPAEGEKPKKVGRGSVGSKIS